MPDPPGFAQQHAAIIRSQQATSAWQQDPVHGAAHNAASHQAVPPQYKPRHFAGLVYYREANRWGWTYLQSTREAADKDATRGAGFPYGDEHFFFGTMYCQFLMLCYGRFPNGEEGWQWDEGNDPDTLKWTLDQRFGSESTMMLLIHAYGGVLFDKISANQGGQCGYWEDPTRDS